MIIGLNPLALTRVAYPSGDPFFSNVVLLTHLDGSPGSTTFVDVTGKTVTGFGNAQVDDISKFGTGSVLLDGTGDYLTAGNAGDFAFLQNLTESYTVEMFVKLTVTTGSQCLMQVGNTSPSLTPTMTLLKLSGGEIIVAYNRTDVAAQIGITGSTITDDGLFHYIAVVYDHNAGEIELFIDAVSQGTVAKVGTFGSDPADVLHIGAYEIPGVFWNGHIDEVRITKGVARSITSVPVTAFSDS